MSTIDEKMDSLGKRFAQMQAKMEEQKKNSVRTAQDVIDNVQNEIRKLSEENRIWAAKNRSRFLAKLLKAQISFTEKKELLKQEITAKKFRSEKQHAEYEAEESAEYAAFSINFALLTMDEAILAFYEATEKLEEYEKNYGE